MKRSASSPFYKPAKRARVAPKKAANVAKTVRATMRRMSTKKCRITTVSEVAVGTAAAGALTNFVYPSAIEDGSTPANRTSARVSLDRLRMSGHFHLTTSPEQADGLMVRMVVGYIRNQTAGSPTFPMFESVDGGGAARTFADVAPGQTLLITTPLNSRDFTTLSDRVITLGTSPGDAKNMYHYDVTIPLRGRKIHYEGNTEGPGKQDYDLVIAAWVADPSNDGRNLACEWTCSNQLFFTDAI